MGLTYPYTLTNATTADADEVMANFDEIKNNLNFDTLDDASANAAAMQATSDPYPAGSVSLSTDGLGELKRLRYVLSQILGTQYWYIYPDMVTKTTTYTATVNDEIILCDTSGGAWTLTLPTAVGVQHKRYIIKKTTSDTNALTIDGNGSETIDGATTRVLYNQYEQVVIVSDNSNWQVIGESSLKTKIVEIGDWNMDAISLVNIAHGLTLANIRSVSVIIRDDSNANYYYIDSPLSSADATSQGGVYSLTASYVNLMRVTSGLFDSTSFDSTSYNRGWIHIKYV